MKSLIILVKMQLKEKMNLKNFEFSGASLFRTLVAVFGAIFKFALVTVLCGVFIFAAQYLNIFGVTQTVPTSVISLIFLIMLALSVISCTIGLTKAMYFSRDNAVLLTLPCKPVQVFLSKLIIFFIYELKRNLSFIVPLFIAYFFTHSYKAIFYPWMLFCIIFVSLFTVSLGALLSIPTMWIISFFRQYKYIQYTTLVLLVGSIAAAVMFAISLIPADIDLLANWGIAKQSIKLFFNEFTVKAGILYNLSLVILGETNEFIFIVSLPLLPTLLRFLLLVGITAALLASAMLIVMPQFYKMASKPFEYLKRETKPKKNRRYSRRVTAVLNEFRIAFKSPDRIYSNVGTLLSVPILIFLLNKIFLAMNTKAFGDQMVIAFNILIMLLVVLNMNCYASSIFSKDGRSSYLIKTQPSKPMIFLLSKLLPNTIFVCLSLLATFVVIANTLSLGVWSSLVLVCAIAFIYLAHMLYCAELDIMNPQYEIYATIGNDDNNPNETKATVSAFVISFIVAIVMLLLIVENAEITTYLKLLGVSLALLCYRTYLFFQNVKLYYKEK